MTSVEKSLLALGVGLAVGASLGILFAPQKGRETRRRLHDGFDHYRDRVVDAFDHLKHKVGDKADMIAEEIEREVSSRVAKASSK